MAELVGIVLVSHSERLACGLRDLLLQISTADVPVEAAGGTDDGRIGTSYERIASAVERADQGAGVLVLADLGSAVLTARTVLADRGSPAVLLVDAPFVEGAVTAAVIAGTGADLQTAAAAAEEARDATKL
jgi:PTS hybrid protein